MRFAEPLTAARFVRRYQRFLADFTLEGGEQVTAHCANPGSMLTCLEPGARAWLSLSDNPRRKLKYTWEIAEVGRTRIYVNPVGANRLVREGIENGTITELGGYQALRSEVPYGERSRIDFLLRGARQDTYVEVKNVTLRLTRGRAGFPDAVTIRGRKHLGELESVVKRGHRGVLLFCVSRTGAGSVAPAESIDPEYASALRVAVSRGVEVLAYRALVSPREVRVKSRIPVELNS